MAQQFQAISETVVANYGDFCDRGTRFICSHSLKMLQYFPILLQDLDNVAIGVWRALV